jgi:hypothetical protein
MIKYIGKPENLPPVNISINLIRINQAIQLREYLVLLLQTTWIPSGSRYGPVAISCDNEVNEKFPDYWSDCYLLKKTSVPRI